MPTWDANQYLNFDEARTRPARDLLSRVAVESPGSIVDVGCGPGNSTALLVERWPEAIVTGIDSSADMLERAGGSVPEARFVEADLRRWTPPSPADVVFSNATLQWVDDHPDVFRHLLSWLAPGGVLAVQMPVNFDQPSHVLLRETAADDRWRAQLDGELRAAPVSSAIGYHRLLASLGRSSDIWTTEYLQVLDGDQAVLEWVRGTALRPVLDRLSTEEAVAFVGVYGERLARAYPPEPDGPTLFPFKRLFIVSG